MQQTPLIWIIDDSPTMCKIIETRLRREGCNVQSFSDGQKVLIQLRDYPQTPSPDIIFVDVMLPRTNGYEVIKWLKQKPQCARSVFLIISRCDGILHRLKGRLVGAQEHIVKPFKMDSIVQVVSKYIALPSHDPDS